MHMVGLTEMKYRIRDFFRFSRTEIRDLVISVLVVTFAFAYNDKSEAFQLVPWLFNFLKILFMVALCFFIHVAAQKIASLRVGYTAEYKIWTAGIYLAIIVSFLSQGKLYIILVGGPVFTHMVIQRLGHFRYGVNILTSGTVAAAGPMMNLIMATFWETLALNGIFPDFFHQMTFINLYWAVFSMIPFPNSSGLWMLMATRLLYAFFFGVLVGYIVLYAIGFYSLIWALILGGVTWVLAWFFIERKAIPF